MAADLIKELAEIETARVNSWMSAVVTAHNQVRRDLASDAVHDFRVALRRCRSIAEDFMVFDPHPAWELMRNESKRLCHQLGALRDTQIALVWVRRLAPPPDGAADVLGAYLGRRELRLKKTVAGALRTFNQRQWTSWSRQLSMRARRLSPEGDAFQHLALERWIEVREKHRQALRNRSQSAFHRLRIALKKFRYTVESFLPARGGLWGAELREIQDLLGEMHDLDVLWRAALAVRSLRTSGAGEQWRHLIQTEKARRMEGYREKMCGRRSAALVWRAGLPVQSAIRSAALARLDAWAAFRDPRIAHSRRVTRLALMLFDGLETTGLAPSNRLLDARLILEAAALTHDVGSSQTRKKHQLASYRLIRQMRPPLGWTSDMLRRIALVARFHSGALPRPEQNAFSGLCEPEKQAIVLLSGVLRLANAFDLAQEGRVDRLELNRSGEAIWITAPGYRACDPCAEKLAAARHLLEAACRRPVMIH